VRYQLYDELLEKSKEYLAGFKQNHDTISILIDHGIAIQRNQTKDLAAFIYDKICEINSPIHFTLSKCFPSSGASTMLLMLGKHLHKEYNFLVYVVQQPIAKEEVSNILNQCKDDVPIVFLFDEDQEVFTLPELYRKVVLISIRTSQHPPCISPFLHTDQEARELCKVLKIYYPNSSEALDQLLIKFNSPKKSLYDQYMFSFTMTALNGRYQSIEEWTKYELEKLSSCIRLRIASIAFVRVFAVNYPNSWKVDELFKGLNQAPCIHNVSLFHLDNINNTVQIWHPIVAHFVLQVMGWLVVPNRGWTTMTDDEVMQLHRGYSIVIGELLRFLNATELCQLLRMILIDRVKGMPFSPLMMLVYDAVRASNDPNVIMDAWFQNLFGIPLDEFRILQLHLSIVRSKMYRKIKRYKESLQVAQDALQSAKKLLGQLHGTMQKNLEIKAFFVNYAAAVSLQNPEEADKLYENLYKFDLAENTAIQAYKMHL
jgi:hypothetical protein